MLFFRSLALSAVALFAMACTAETASDEPTTAATADELRVCAGDSTLQGIDVSVYQGSVDGRR